MKRLLTITILVAAMASCQPRQGKNVEDLPGHRKQCTGNEFHCRD
jgi:hypothetical protein